MWRLELWPISSGPALGRSAEPRGRARRDGAEAPPYCRGEGARGCAARLPATTFPKAMPERCSLWLAKV